MSIALILRLAPYAAILLALAWGGIEHTWRVTLQRDAAREVAEAQAKVAAYQEQDAIKSRAIADAHAAEVARLRGEASARELSILRAAASRECLASPAGRAFLDGLRQPGKADPGSPAGPGRAGAAVSR